MFTRSGFEKTSDTPVPKRHKRRSSSMPPKLDAEGLQARAASPAERPTMMFTGSQFDKLMKSFDASSQRAAEAAQAAAHDSARTLSAPESSR